VEYNGGILVHHEMPIKDKKLLALFAVFLESRMSQKKFKIWYDVLRSPLFDLSLPNINVNLILKNVPEYLSNYSVFFIVYTLSSTQDPSGTLSPKATISDKKTSKDPRLFHS